MKSKNMIYAMEQFVLENNYDGKLPIFCIKEISDIVAEFLEEVYKQGNIATLETNILDARKIDIDSISKVINIIKEHRPSNYTLNVIDKDNISVDISKKIESFEGYLGKISDAESINGQYILELFCDPEFNKILIAFDMEHEIFRTLVDLVSRKVESISNDSMLIIWAELKNNFEGTRRDGFINYKEIIPEEFWSSKLSMSDIKKYYST
ncbi:MAG: hypothetical protein KC414_12565, partial [Romboutsia sp.]|nr:hypothetical protein [Romboutsia sp.]